MEDVRKGVLHEILYTDDMVLKSLTLNLHFFLFCYSSGEKKQNRKKFSLASLAYRAQ